MPVQVSDQMWNFKLEQQQQPGNVNQTEKKREKQCQCPMSMHCLFFNCNVSQMHVLRVATWSAPKVPLYNALQCANHLHCLIYVCLLTWLALVGLVQSRRDLFDQKCSEKKYRCIFIWPELSLTNITKITKKSKGQWKENCWCTGWFFHWYLDSIAVSLFGGKLLLVHQVCADQWEYCPKSGGQQGSKFQEHI